MSNESKDAPEELSFGKAEFTTAGGAQPAECGFCKQALVGAYYLFASRPTCERCKTQYELSQASDSGGRFLRAAVFGALAAAAGSILWYTVRVLSGYEVGLIAVVVGLMVGRAVRVGSRHRGGPLYQALAMALTYVGICGQYVPDMVNQVRQHPAQQQAQVAAEAGAAVTPVTSTAAEARPEAPAPAPTFGRFVMALGLLFGLALAIPFLGGFQNIIGILIIGFAVYEAWKINRRVPFKMEGPFRLGTEAR